MTKTREAIQSGLRTGGDAKVALESSKGEHTLAELATTHGLHPNLITNWKQQVVEVLRVAPRLPSRPGGRRRR